MKAELQEPQKDSDAKKDVILLQVFTLGWLLARVSRAPVVQRLNTETDSLEEDGGRRWVVTLAKPDMSVLAKCPRNLYVLWDEWEVEVNSMKPLKDFTVQEWGHQRYKFSQRLVFWRLVHEMVLRGTSLRQAVDRMYNVYGQHMLVTKTLIAINADKRNGRV